MLLTHEHEELRRSVIRWAEEEINPHINDWEEAQIFPAHQVFKSLGDKGFLGIHKPEKFGGLGLDFSYAAVMAEALAAIRAGGVPMAIGVQTDMCTPALSKHGSAALCEEFLRPAIAGDLVGCIGVSEPGGGSDVAAVKTTKADYVAFEGYNTSIGDFGWSRGMFQNVCPDGDEFVRKGLTFVRPLVG